MATTKMRSDELNIISTEQKVEKRNIIGIDQFFDEMYLTESEKKERKDLAKAIFVILSAILTIIKANDTVGNEHDADYYKEYVSEKMKDEYRGTFGSDKYASQVDNFADNFIEVTMRNLSSSTNKDAYFTSDDRATVNAENESNTVFNERDYEDAVAEGKTEKEWLTMQDGRVRKTHQEADGQRVPIGDPFEVGGYLMMHPCDKSLGAHSKECINCRCLCIYF